MGRKNRIEPFAALKNVDISTDQTGSVSDIGHLDNVCYLIYWSGTTPVGTLIIECTNDDPKTVSSPRWVQLDFGSAIVISGNSGDHLINIAQAPFNFIRPRYAKTSGTGTLNAILHVKQVGG